MAQDSAPQASPLILRGEVEVFNPLLIGFCAHRNHAGCGARNLENKSVRRVKTGKEALPYAHWVPAPQAFEVGPHDLGTELGYP